MNQVYTVAVIPGDGIGPEVTASSQRVLDAVGERFGFEFEWQAVTAGGAGIDAYGEPLRDQDLDLCAAADAVLLGAVGGSKWDAQPATNRPEQALFKLRRGLGLFANLRPVSIEPALIGSSPLRPARLRGVDLLIVRELTGGLYFGDRVEQRDGPDGREASDSLPYSEREIRRIVRLAFDLARLRRGRVTSVDKANVLATSRLWRTIATEVGAEYRDVILEHTLVDSCAMQLISHPSGFDVLVTENMFGDILSDEASVLAGSLGMLPSASLGERKTKRGTFGMYEPVHGSAPDIAGLGIANPIGAILSGALLLRWSLGRADAAAVVEHAVRQALGKGNRTADLMKPGSEDEPISTRVMTDAIVAAITQAPTQAPPPRPPVAPKAATAAKPPVKPA